MNTTELTIIPNANNRTIALISYKDVSATARPANINPARKETVPNTVSTPEKNNPVVDTIAITIENVKNLVLTLNLSSHSNLSIATTNNRLYNVY
jgi:hypothetical protein